MSVEQGTPTSLTVMNCNQKVTTTTATNQVVSTYTVPAGYVFYLTYSDVQCNLTTPTTTATAHGTIALWTAGVVYFMTWYLNNQTTDTISHDWLPSVAIPSGTVINFQCNPASTASRMWNVNFGGYLQ